MILRAGPRLICAGVRKADAALLALTLDLAVPPLGLLGVLLIAVLAASGLGNLLGLSPVALLISSACVAGYSCALLVCWLINGRDVLRLDSVQYLPRYVYGKLRLYRAICLERSAVEWRRTERRNEQELSTFRKMPPGK